MLTPAQNPRGAARMICMTASSSERDTNPQVNRRGGDSSNGPTAKAISLPQAEAYCRRLARSHYENFLVASLLLPRAMRQPFYNVYAFCRYADDLADESDSPQLALQHLHHWQVQLQRCFAGQAEHPIYIALRDTQTRFQLAIEPFEQLLDAFRQDQFKTRYATFAELLHYCQRSANPVGRIVLRLAAADSPENVALSDQICTGLQLANHWQDIGRDFQAGRIYLPQDAMQTHGVTEAMLGEHRASEPLRRLIAAECKRARSFFEAGRPLIQRVPRWLACDIGLFIRGGLATLDAIAAVDYDVLRQRPTVSRWQQLRWTCQAALDRLTSSGKIGSSG